MSKTTLAAAEDHVPLVQASLMDADATVEADAQLLREIRTEYVVIDECLGSNNTNACASNTDGGFQDASTSNFVDSTTEWSMTQDSTDRPFSNSNNMGEHSN